MGDLISRLRDCERRVVVGWICHFEGLVSIVDSFIVIRIDVIRKENRFAARPPFDFDQCAAEVLCMVRMIKSDSCGICTPPVRGSRIIICKVVFVLVLLFTISLKYINKHHRCSLVALMPTRCFLPAPEGQGSRRPPKQSVVGTKLSAAAQASAGLNLRLNLWA